MTVTTTWANTARTLLMQRHADTWTWDEYFESLATAQRLAATVSHSVDLISFFERGSLHPDGGVIAPFTRGMTMLPPNLRHALVVVDNTFIRAAVMLLRNVRAYDSRVRTVRSLADAYWLIEHSDAEIARV
jgi:hypothetical protein